MIWRQRYHRVGTASRVVGTIGGEVDADDVDQAKQRRRRKSRIGDGVKVSRHHAIPGLVLAHQRDALVDDELVVLEGAVGLDPLTKLAALDLEAVRKQADDVH